MLGYRAESLGQPGQAKLQIPQHKLASRSDSFEIALDSHFCCVIFSVVWLLQNFPSIWSFFLQVPDSQELKASGASTVLLNRRMLSLRVLAVGRFDSIHSCLDMFSLSLGKRQSVIPQEQGSVCMLCTDMSHFRFPMSSPYCHIECFMILNHSGCYTLSVSSHVVLCLCNLLGRLSSPSILQVHCDFLNLFHLIFAALCLVLHS